MNIVIVGHVDHGKSTLIGRLLADTGSLPEGKLEQVRELCARTSKPFEYAFLLDALKDERSQGITIDTARVFFKTEKRPYIILDAPGHVEFLKNMVSGAARADAALLVIDAQEGIRENSRRHGYLLSMLGIRQMAVLVNKMDLVGYSKDRFDALVSEYKTFLAKIGLEPQAFLPVSGFQGANVAAPAKELSWFKGPTVLEQLDQFVESAPAGHQPFRLPVQDVYKFTKGGDTRRIVAGTVESGRARVGDELTFYPSGKKSRIRTIEAFLADGAKLPTEVEAGWATGFTLDEQIYVSRGELASISSAPSPQIGARIKTSLFWLGKNPLVPGRRYILKLGTSRVDARLEKITRTLDASSLDASDQAQEVKRHEVADCVLSLSRPIAFDVSGDPGTESSNSPAIDATSRFVLVDDYEIAGGGIIREALKDERQKNWDQLLKREFKWERGLISRAERERAFRQKSRLILISGERPEDRKTLAKELESTLFQKGKLTYYLGMGSVVHGLDADIENRPEDRQEHLRRLTEIAHIMTDAGMILIVTTAPPEAQELEQIRAGVRSEMKLVWVGKQAPTNFPADMTVSEPTKAVVAKLISQWVSG